MQCSVSQEQDAEFDAHYENRENPARVFSVFVGKEELGRFDLLRLIAAVFDSNFLAARRLRQRHLNLEHSIFEPGGLSFLGQSPSGAPIYAQICRRQFHCSRIPFL